MDIQAICKTCGHNFFSHQLPYLDSNDTFIREINKENTRCRHTEHSIPDCGCKGFTEMQFTSMAEKKRYNRQKS